MKRILIIPLFFICFSLSATNYYVKNGGNDGDTGADDAHAWETITKVNATAFNGDDSIFFKRDDTWVVTSSSDALVIDRSGTSGHVIYFGAYDTGAKPIITGRTSVTGWNTAENWTNVSGNIWSMTTDIISNVFSDNNRGRIWLDGVEVAKAESTTIPTSSLKWTHNGQTLYVYSVGNPSGVYSNIESIGTNNYSVYCTNDYITIKYLDIRGSGNCFLLSGADYNTIDSCLIGRDVGTSGLYIYNSNDGVVKDCVFNTYDTIYDIYDQRVNTEDGIIVVQTCGDWDIYDNQFTNWGHACFEIVNGGNYPVTNILLHDNYMTAPNIDYSRGFTYNIHSSTTQGTCTGNEYYNNYIYRTTICNQISGDGLKMYCNIIDSVKSNTYHKTYEQYNMVGSGLVLSSYSGYVNNNEIYNNVIMNCYDPGILFPGGNSYEIEDNYIKNNILFNNDDVSDYQLYIEFDNPGLILENVIQYNLLYKSGVTDVVYDNKYSTGQAMTIAEFNAKNLSTTNIRSGQVPDIIGNNITGDPTLVGGSPYDYSLQAGSPAIATGIGVGLNTDYAGEAWKPTPSIGAYEYNSEPPDPPGLPIIYTLFGYVSNFSAVTIQVGGLITDDGGGTITESGVCWSTLPNPTTADNKRKSSLIVEDDFFLLMIGGLHGGVTYHFRAYCINESGTAYGADYVRTTPEYSVVISSGKTGVYNNKIGILK